MASVLPREQGVERSILQWLDALGWETYGLGDDWGARVLDRHYGRSQSEVVYWSLLREQLLTINEDLSEGNVDSFLSSLRREFAQDELMEGNRQIHRLIRRGKAFKAKHSNGTSKPTYIDLIDYEAPERNRFIAVNQFQVSRTHTARPDITLLVNGLPIVHFELKSLAQDNDYYDAIRDLAEYERDVPRLFFTVLFNVAADTTELRYGAVGAPSKFYQPWSKAPSEYKSDNGLKQSVQALCNPDTLLDILHNFVFYEQATGGLIKIVPRHMQYYATRRLLERVTARKEKRGLVWHTQGSGKSYTMLYAAKNLLERDILPNPQIFIIVDTDKLASQMADDLSNVGFERSVVAGSMAHLQDLIEEGKSQLVLTTIQKFERIRPESAGNPHVVVMSDEAHRFMEKDLGSRLDAAMPDAYHFGFTGTPVHEGDSEIDRNTFRNFSPKGEECLHRYSIREGIQDGLILPVHFRLWHDVEWDIDEDAMDVEFEQSFKDLSPDRRQELIKSLTSSDLAELQVRVEAYVEKINEHFDEKTQPNGWKAMVVTPSREAAALYGECLVRSRSPEEVAVLYTANPGDSEELRQFHTTDEERRRLTNDFREEENPKILVVHNMLLTGFDAPVLKTMYLDRKLKNHNLLQAIARTNRPEAGKNNGEVVDFQGVFQDIDAALQYDTETRAWAARDVEVLFEELEELLDQLEAIFEGIPKDDSQEALNECLARVSKHPEKREFRQGYRKVQDLYESISPDGRLITSGAQRRYAWLSRVFVAFRRSHNRDEDPERSMREKTREIVEKYVDVDEIKDQYPIFQIGEEHLEAVRKLKEASTQATSIAHALQDHLRPRVHKNPRYKRLSERVNEVVEQWQSGELADLEAVEELEALEREAIRVSEEADERDMGDAEYALYSVLVDECGSHIGDEGEAQEIAEQIYDEFTERIDTEYEAWKTNESALRQIEELVIRLLVKEYGAPELVKEARFHETARELLVANYD